MVAEFRGVLFSGFDRLGRDAGPGRPTFLAHWPASHIVSAKEALKISW
jgi:hypothetical protein